MRGQAQQAKQLNGIGNSFSRQKRWEDAIDAYSQAITLCPRIPCYWINRALCNFKRKDWAKVEEDCRKAIQLDKKLVQARHMLGLSLLERRKYAEGVRKLEKALDLARGANPNGNMVKRIRRDLARGKNKEWQIASDERSQELCDLREACVRALEEMHSQMKGSKDEVAACPQQLEALKRVFHEVAEADKHTDVPDHLCCRITHCILQDPVITPCGHTYERAAITRHLQESNLDPTTRRQLDASQLVPNLAIKEAVEAFLDKHGWAYEEVIDAIEFEVNS